MIAPLFKRLFNSEVSCALSASIMFVSGCAWGQEKYDTYNYRALQVSFFPGLSTNGINPVQFKNNVSINFISGYSGGTTAFEVGGLSNFNKSSSTGIQIAGAVNVIGGDRKIVGKKYNPTELEKIKEGFTGFQASGLTNMLTGDFRGFQLTGGFNLNGGIVEGVQFAGFANSNSKYYTGFQLAGIFNYNEKYTSGFQAAGVLNYSRDDLFGVQLGTINRTANTYGKRSKIDVDNGYQIGIINFAKDMDGFQIGLINRARSVEGVQIGLINFYKKNKQGVPIGLFNYGNGSESVRLWMSELFLLNGGIATGSRRVRNTLFFSYNPFAYSNWPKRAYGYSISRIRFLDNGKRFKSLELALSWLNLQDNNFNLLINPKYLVARHIGRGIYFDFSAGLNYYYQPVHQEKNIGLFASPVWPSLSVGIHSD